MLGGCCMRSALAYGGALGSFAVWARRRLAATSFSASNTARTATTSPSSSGPRGQLDVVATLSRTLPRPAAPPFGQVPLAGPSRQSAPRPGRPYSTLGAMRPASTTDAVTCTATTTGTAARLPVGQLPRARLLRLSAQQLNEASCRPALARASSQGQEGGRRGG